MMVRTDRKNNRSDWVISPPDEVHLTLGGVTMEGLCRCFRPEPKALRQMLLDLRGVHRWSQGFAASVLGVSVSTIVKWESGVRNPTGSAAKLIFLLYSQHVERKDRVRNCWDLATWGKMPCRSEDAQKLCDQLIALNGTFVVPEAEVLASVGEAPN
jgi:transcriptional regulator with XRE-family HTH domain